MELLENNRHAGATTDKFSEAKNLYLTIRVNDSVYGVIGNRNRRTIAGFL